MNNFKIVFIFLGVGMVIAVVALVFWNQLASFFAEPVDERPQIEQILEKPVEDLNKEEKLELLEELAPETGPTAEEIQQQVDLLDQLRQVDTGNSDQGSATVNQLDQLTPEQEAKQIDLLEQLKNQ